MNYQHDYHAGNFADVFKHLLLIALLQHFHQKDKPFVYFDTHAGAGLYDLLTENAQKTQEYVQGIKRLWQAQAMPQLVSEYVQHIRDLNLPSVLQKYPGSPYLASLYLRPQDSMQIVELNLAVAQNLKKIFFKNHKVATHIQDGYQALKAYLSPKLGRGLILIDPPYELKTEYNTLIEHVRMALKKFPTGTYAIWYPIKTKEECKQFYKKLITNFSDYKMLNIEFWVGPLSVCRLNACGMIIINPPWQLQEKVEPALQWLVETLKIEGSGQVRFNTLQQ